MMFGSPFLAIEVVVDKFRVFKDVRSGRWVKTRHDQVFFHCTHN